MKNIARKIALTLILLNLTVLILKIQLVLLDTGLPLDKAVVHFYPQEVSAYVGEEITTSLVIFNVTGFYAFDVEFSWNTTILQYVDHNVTTPVEDYPNPQDPSPYAGIMHSQVLQFRNVIDENGSIPGAEPETKAWFAYSSMPPAPVFSGNGTIFTMTLNVVSPGTCDLILLSVELSDINADPIECYKFDGKFSTPEKPFADFTFSPTEPHINDTIIFNATLSKPHGGIVTSYMWDFGDSNITTVSTPLVTHFYIHAESFNVTLTITDSEELNDSTWIIIVVSDIHDVSILDISTSTLETYIGHLVNITTIVKNEGTATENFNVTTYYNTTSLETKLVTNLTRDTEATLTFTWNTTGVHPGPYVVSAEASTVPGETEVINNYLTDGIVNARLPPDIAITDVTHSKTVVGQGYLVMINVTVENRGDAIETFDLTVDYNSNIIETLPITLEDGALTTGTFTWNTTGITLGSYIISTYASQLPDEANITDNIFTDGWITVTIPGDVDGDFDVDLYDAVKLLTCYGVNEGEPKYDPNLDINGNDQIYLYDAVILLSNYGQKDQ